MPIYQIVVLGIVQGLTEFLPVSSSGHLYLTSWLLGWKTEGLDFDIMLHLGTLVAVLLYFGRDWVQIIAHGFGVRMGGDEALTHNSNLLWMLALGTIPGAIAGALFEKQADSTLRNPFVIGSMLIVVGLLMWAAESGSLLARDLSMVTFLDALSIGIAQALAIVPGTSRSGVTITMGLFRNLDREAAAKFSFLLSTPIIAGAAGKALYNIHKEHGLHDLFSSQFLIGVGVSALTGCIVIGWFLRYLHRSTLRPFVYYRLAFGIIVLALAFIRRPA
ncbi:MAG TPA: undecaprenyl-diphosphate phosphatase [Bryobacteraceae bacterium]|jgi:undecaprenyl-diphosphatase|nr:undecaprenyl-diphosphate phosphatase [Bryobacteraceae bacterium]